MRFAHFESQDNLITLRDNSQIRKAATKTHPFKHPLKIVLYVDEYQDEFTNDL